MKGYKTIETIEKTHRDPGGFSFEYSDIEVSIVIDGEGKRYLRVYKKECAAEGNGRPVTTISDYCIRNIFRKIPCKLLGYGCCNGP